MKSTTRNPLLLILTGTLVACGGNSNPTPANTPPTVSVKSDGRAITTSTYLRSGGTVQVAVSDPDVGGSITKVTYTIDGGAATTLTPAASITLPIGNLTGGQHELALSATDNQNATTSIKVPFLIDAAAPIITQLNLNGQAADAATTYTIGDAVLLDVTARDTRGDTAGTTGPITAIRVYENGTPVKSGSGATLNVDLSKATSGQARAAGTSVITVEAEDSVGFVTTRTLTLTFNAATDNGGVVAPTFTWLSPASDFVKGGGTVVLRATATRNGQDLSSQIVYTATCGSITGDTWALGTNCADGSKQSVTATVTDGGRSFSSPAKIVTVDASDPTVQITSPQQGQTFTQNPIKISVTGTDAVSGLDRILVEASKDGVTYTQIGVVTAASGDVVWAPMNGTYTIRATATDKTGRTNSTTVSGVRVNLTSSDTTPPSVTLAPIPATPQRATITVTATASDSDSGVAKVDLYDGGTLITSNATGINGKYTFSVDTTKLSDGAHTLRAVAFDNAGQSAETTANLTVDNAAPVVNWISPADGAVTRGTVTLNATSNEGTVTYTVDGSTITGNTVTFQTDGTHTITATAQDAAGNRTTSTIKVTSDATAPTAQITSPTSGSTLTSNPITISAAGNDSGSGVSSLEVFANGTSIGTISGASGTVTWTPTSGTYDLTVIATDRAGNMGVASAPVNVTVKLATADTTAPAFVGTATVQPAPTATFSRGVITLDGFVKDPESGISQVALFNGGVRLTATPSLSLQPDGSTRYALTLDSKTLADGTYTLTIQATNGVGLVSNQDVSVKIDNTAPTLNWNAPTTVGSAGTITLNATTDTGATITYAASCGTITGTTWTYGDCQDGTAATLTATATDAAGNTTTQTRTMTVDRTAPTVQITSPTQGQKVTQNPITITVSGTDNIAVERIDVLSGTTRIGTVTGAQGSVTWAAPNGNQTLTARAYDRAGNVTETQISFTVALTTSDTTAPTGAVTTPAGDLRGQTTVSVTASDTDSGVATVSLYVDGLLSSTQTTGIAGTYTFPVDTTKLSDGNHAITAVITDKAGNSTATPSVTARVNNAAPTVTITNPQNGALLGKNSDLTVKATGTDSTPGDALTYEYSVDGGTFSATLPALPQQDGTHTITVRATDKAGNTGTATSTYTYDGTAPTVQITSPTQGQKFTQNPITIAVSGTDNVAVDHIDVFDGTTKIGTVTGGQGTVTWAGSNGAHQLTAKGYDKAGNEATSSAVDVTMDVPPASSTITASAPTANATNTYGTAPDPLYILGLGTIAGSATSTPATIVSAELLIDGQASGTPTNTAGSVTFNFDFGKLNEGLHDIVLRWRDTANTVTDSAKLSVYIDKSAPTIIWNRPVAGSTINGVVTLDTTVTDTGAGFNASAAQFYLDGDTTPLTDADANIPGFQFNTNGIVPGNHTLTEVVSDRLGNRAQQSITVNTVTKPTVEITNSADLKSGLLSGYVSINVDAKDQSGIKQVELFANDVKVATLTSAPYNFALNTANYTNGPVTLFARATNNSTPNQTTDTAPVTITAFNRVAPVLAIASPASGSSVTSPSLPVQLSINKKNSAFTVNGGTVKLDLLDYRGQQVDSKTVAVSDNVDGVYTSAAFDLAKLPADTYTIRASMTVVLDGTITTTTTVEATSQITTNTASVNPPAAVVRIPVTLANGTNATVVSGSGFLVNVSDDTGVQYVQVRFVNKDGTPLNNSYLLNQGFDTPPKYADIVIPNLDIDGSQYVPDGEYNIRVTVADTTGNRNIQEVPVTVDRSASNNPSTNTYSQSVVTTPLTAKATSGALTYDNATWTLTGVNNASRVAAVIYKDGKVIGTRVEVGVTGNQSVNYTFGDVGSYEVAWIVEDLTTGVVKYVTGTAVGVSRNP
ncbi:beta strand repeat-containing protein [Deinococcus sp. RM]|uniref:beta strand repeat-containing protein n=1 Tax=Deinococcus sp. RM TaxID=2316359 RepID=UPI000E6961DF|nr:Ig-like domain-containing protein [Deinococcus sp. RM]RIY02283.1 hypothetical protein D3W47_14640 [Deinococcus sp. RM]